MHESSEDVKIEINPLLENKNVREIKPNTHGKFQLKESWSAISKNENDSWEYLVCSAIQNGDQKKVDELQEQNTFKIMNVIDEIGYTLPHWAAHNGNTDMMVNLLQLFDVKSISESPCKVKLGNTPLHIAVSERQYKIIEILIKHDVNVNVTNNIKQTPLHLAALCSHEVCANMLLEANVEVNVQDDKGYSPLHFAVRHKAKDVTALLKKYYVQINIVNDDKNTLPHDTILYSYGRKKCLNFTERAKKIAQNIIGCIPLCSSIRQGDHKIVKLLIKSGANINIRNEEEETPLLSAVRLHDVESFKLLLAAGVEINSKNLDEVTSFALKTKRLDIFNLLLDHVPNIAVKNNSSYKLVAIAMINNVPGVVCALINVPPEDRGVKTNDKEITATYLEDRLDGCITLEGKAMKVDFKSIMPPNYQNLDALLLLFSCISRDNKFQNLLLHSTSRTFLKWMWKQIAPYYYVNLLCILIACLNIFIYKSYFYYSSEKTNAIGKVSFSFMIGSLFGLIFREFLQIYVDWRLYVRNFENYSEILFILHTIIISFTYSMDTKTKIQISTIGNQILALNITLFLGHHPWAASAVNLLKVVTYKFMQYFIVYMIIVISFAYSFYELYNIKHIENNLDNNNETIKINETEFFLFRELSILRTVEMFVGGINLVDFKLKNNDLLLIAVLFFFIVFVSVVILNLLNGIAVSNILEEEKLKISDYKARFEYLYRFNCTIRFLNKMTNKLRKREGCPTVINNLDYIDKVREVYVLPNYKTIKELNINESYAYIYCNSLYKEINDTIQKIKIKNTDSKNDDMDKIIEEIEKIKKLMLANKRNSL